MGDHQEWPLVGDRLTVGRSPTCDIQLPSPKVSMLHCTLERREGVWFAVDAGSANGILDEFLVPRTEIELRPGVVWYIAKTAVESFTAVNKRSRADLLPLVGMTGTWPAYVDAALTAARSAAPIVIVDPPGGGGDRVAAILHGASPRRWLPLATTSRTKDALAVVAGAARSTVVMRREHIPRDTAALHHACAAHSVRLIVLSRRPLAPDHYGPLLNGAMTLPLRPLSERGGELATLAEHLASQIRHRMQQPHLQLDPAVIEQATTRTWRRNVEDLELYLSRVLVLKAHGGKHNRTASALNVAPSTLSKWRRRYEDLITPPPPLPEPDL